MSTLSAAESQSLSATVHSLCNAVKAIPDLRFSPHRRMYWVALLQVLQVPGLAIASLSAVRIKAVEALCDIVVSGEPVKDLENLAWKTLQAIVLRSLVQEDGVGGENWIRKVLKAIRVLLLEIYEEKREILMGEKARPLVYCVLCNCLEMASEKKWRGKTLSRDTKEESLETVQKVLLGFRFHVNAAEKVGNFLPGVISSCCKILFGDFKQGTPLFCSALKTLEMGILLCMSDKVWRDKIEPASSMVSPVEALRNIEQALKQQDELENNSKNTVSLKEENQFKNSLESMSFDGGWFVSTQGRICKILHRLFATNAESSPSLSIQQVPVDHLGYKFRRQQVDTIYSLLSECSIFIKPVSELLTETLISLLEDEFSEVSEVAKEYMSKLQVLDVQTIIANFRKHCMRLSEILGGFSERRKLSAIRMCTGHLKLILHSGSIAYTLPLFFSNGISHQPDSALTALLQCIRLEYKDSFVRDRTATLNPEYGTQIQPFQELRFQLCSSSDLVEAMNDMLSILGSVLCHICCLEQVIDALCDMIHTDLFHLRAEACYLAYSLLLGAYFSCHDSSTVKRCALRIFEELMDEEVWNMSVGSRQEISSSEIVNESSDISLVELSIDPKKLSSSDSLLLDHTEKVYFQMHLAVRTIGKLSVIFGEEFPVRDILNPMLLKLASDNFRIKDTTICSLQQIALAMGDPNGNICQLVMDNMDYVVDAVSAKLKYDPEDSSCGEMLQALVDYTRNAFDKSKMLRPLLLDVIKDVDNALEEVAGDPEHELSYLRALRAVMQSLAQSMDSNKSIFSDYTPSLVDKESYSSSEVVRRIELSLFNWSALNSQDSQVDWEEDQELIPPHELLENRRNAEQKENAEDDEFLRDYEEMMEHEKTSREENTEPSPEDKLIASVLKKCQHFVNSDDAQLRNSALDILSHGIVTLSQCENELLPLIATIWAPLSSRFHDSSRSELLSKTLLLIENMGDLAQKFLSRRLHSELWPVLKSSLSEMVSEANRSRLWTRNYFETTANFKLQVRILRFVLKFCSWKQVRIDVEQIVPVLLRLYSNNEFSAVKKDHIQKGSKSKQSSDIPSCAKTLLELVSSIIYETALRDADKTWSLVKKAIQNRKSSGGREQMSCLSIMIQEIEKLPEQRFNLVTLYDISF